jgi:hypothetical protein
MPVAVANVEDSQRFELKTAPPDGFVVLKRMTFGQIVQRRAMLKLAVTSGANKSFQGEMAMASEEVSRFEFNLCIVDHNLEDENGNKLNLGSAIDFARLDPRVGQEIEGHISDLNNLDEDDDRGN